MHLLYLSAITLLYITLALNHPSPSLSTSLYSTPPREYIAPDHERDYHDQLCTVSCREGACKFKSCGISPLPQATCNGGLCEFVSSVNGTCNGGLCVFYKSTGGECGGGGCQYIHPVDTLKDGFCKGGGCSLNGVKIPKTFKNQLTT